MKIKSVSTYIQKFFFLRSDWYLQESFSYSLLFFFCAIGLFLGDGKQPFIDLVAIMFTLFLYFHASFFKITLKPLPKILWIIWILIVGYFIVLTLFSDSIGLSISTTIRTITIFLIIRYFYGRKTNSSIKIFSHGLLILSFFAIFASFFFIIFPNLAQRLPSMNLVYASFGHNQLAGLLFLSLPLMLHFFLTKSSVKNVVLFTIFFVAFFLSFARGAFILFCVYLVFLIIKNMYSRKYTQSVFLISILTFFILVLAALGLLAQYKTVPLPISYWLRKQITKPFDLEDTRLLYWKQAWEALKDAPLFGHGPGTFNLLSKRYQEGPNQYSYYAHSLPLETLAEGGIIAGFLFLYLFFIVFKNAEKEKESTNMLFHGFALFLLYSLVEFNYNFLTLSTFFWVGISLLYNESHHKNWHLKIDILAVKFFTFLIAVYYFLSLSSLVLSSSKSPKLQLLSLYIAPFDRFQILENIRISSLNQNQVTMISSIHRYDDQVIRKLLGNDSNGTPIHSGNFELYRNLILANPQNLENYLWTTRNKPMSESITKIRTLLLLLTKGALRSLNNDTLGMISAYFNTTKISNDLITVTKEENNNITHNQKLTTREYLARIYYQIGVRNINNPTMTRALWTLSTILDPSVSYYSVELFNLYRIKLSDINSAYEILDECQKNDSAAKHCKDIKNAYMSGKLEQIPDLGYFQKVL